MEEGSGIGSRLVRWWRSIPPLVADTLLAALVLAVTLIEIAFNDESLDGRNRALSLALLVAMSLVIVVRRLHPVAVWLVSGVLVTLYGVASFPDPVLPYGPLIAVYTVAAYTVWRTAAVAGVVTLIEIAFNDESLNGRSRVLSLALLVAMSLVIVFRRLHPVAVWLVSGALVTVYGVASFPDPVLPYGPLIAVYTVAAYTVWRTAAIAGVVTAVVIALSMIIDPHDDLVDWLIAFLSTTTAWLVGNNVRTHRAYTHELEAKAARLERERRTEAERAVADERLRLARELHDVAAHHVSVIALHAEAGQSLLPDDPERADQAFGVIAQVARSTLTELRRVVGVLREGAAPLVPQPGLDQLPALVREVERAGVPVTLTVSGTPGSISRTLDTSAYRIVQEALTNVLRHAGPATAQVTVTYEPDAVAVEILDDGRGPTATPVNGDGDGGHGLAGMRERATMFGGTLTAEARPERGFAVAARLPR